MLVPMLGFKAELDFVQGGENQRNAGWQVPKAKFGRFDLNSMV